MQFTPNQSTATKLDSDRESLPFPRGGVFAGQAAPNHEKESEMITSTEDIIANVDRLFDAMQQQLDTIAEEADKAYRMPHFDEDDFDPRPAA